MPAPKGKFFLFHQTLRTRLVLYFTTLAVVPLVLMGVAAITLVNTSHNYDVSQLERQVLNQKIGEIEDFFSAALDSLDLRVVYEEFVPIAVAQQEFLLEAILEEHDGFEMVAFVDLIGYETTKQFRSGEIHVLRNVGEESYVTESLRGRSYVGPVIETPSGQRMMLASPVRNKQGQIIQIFSAEISLGSVRSIIEEVESSNAGYYGYVASASGNLIAHSRGIEAEDDFKNDPRIVAVRSGEVFNGLGKKDRYISYFGATPVVGAGQRIKGLDWPIFVEWPVGSADFVVNNLKSQIIKFIVLGVLIGFVLSNILASSIIRPIRDLREFANRIGKGDFGRQIELNRHDELQELGITLNKTARGLEQLQKLKNEFVFVAAHELQTPVTSIRWNLNVIGDILAKEPQSAIAGEVANIREGNDRLIQLVRDLLEVARSEVGRLKVEVHPISLKEPIAQVLQEVKALAKKTKVTVSYKSKQLPKVMADVDKVVAIVSNLVSNAIKYNRSGGEVLVSHEINKNKVITHVRDTGFGIAKRDQKKLFQKFYRVQTPSTKNIPGTGLGLFIVKESIERQGGRIWFESKEGEGTTFSFELPQVKAKKGKLPPA